MYLLYDVTKTDIVADKQLIGQANNKILSCQQLSSIHFYDCLLFEVIFANWRKKKNGKNI